MRKKRRKAAAQFRKKDTVESFRVQDSEVEKVQLNAEGNHRSKSWFEKHATINPKKTREREREREKEREREREKTTNPKP